MQIFDVLYFTLINSILINMKICKIYDKFSSSIYYIFIDKNKILLVKKIILKKRNNFR